jgi:hypothetical protein
MLAMRLSELQGEEERRVATRDRSLDVTVTHKRCMA